MIQTASKRTCFHLRRKLDNLLWAWLSQLTHEMLLSLLYSELANKIDRSQRMMKLSWRFSSIFQCPPVHFDDWSGVQVFRIWKFDKSTVALNMNSWKCKNPSAATMLSQQNWNSHKLVRYSGREIILFWRPVWSSITRRYGEVGRGLIKTNAAGRRDFGGEP